MSAISSSRENSNVSTRLDTSKNEIRLLLLQPSHDPQAQIQCFRKKTSLNDKPRFEALSYTWGDPAVVEPVLLDDEEFNVTVGAWSALKALRYEDRPRVLWMDAICINQTDPEEKAEQLKLMGTVYRQASSVRVWLGEDDQGDKEAMSILKAMTITDGARNTLELGYRPEIRRKQVQQFLARSWWERLWVVQEVALGRHVVFQQGCKELEWKELLTACYTSQKYFGEQLQMYRYGSYSSGPYNFMEIFESVKVLNRIRELCGADFAIDGPSHIRESTMNWAIVANLLRDKKASVDKDRLYALYGLLPATVVQRLGMKPSYTSTTEQTFIDITYSIIEGTQSLMMFNFLNRRTSEGSLKLPSWVPDWRLAPGNRWEGNLRVSRESLFSASQQTPFYIQKLSSNAICLKGFFVDLVQIYKSIPLVPTASPILDACHNSWREMWANTDPDNAMLTTYPDGTSAETAFRRTMVWDCAPGTDEEALTRLTQEEGMAMFEAHDLAVKIAYGEDRDIAGQNLSVADVRRTNYMMNCAKGRAFFATAMNFVGMTLSNVEAGDHIFIAAGNSHPVILRPSKKYADTWHAVGECYLHAFMDGAGVHMSIGNPCTDCRKKEDSCKD